MYGLTDLKLGTVTDAESYQTRSFLILVGIYVRFASVYRKFKDVGQFVEEVKGLQREDKAKPVTPAKPKVVAKTK